MTREDGFKEVCAHFGAAMYFAQVLEHGIANALLFFDLIPRTSGRWDDDEYEEFFTRNFAKTLGNLIKTLKEHTAVPDNLNSALNESRERRAFLAHHFFRERVDDVQRGYFERLIEELEENRSHFEKTDQMLSALVRPLMERHGWNAEKEEAALNAYKSHLERRP